MARANPYGKRPLTAGSRACWTTPPDGSVAKLTNAFHVHEHDAQSSKSPDGNETHLHLIRTLRDPEAVVDRDHNGVEPNDE